MYKAVAIFPYHLELGYLELVRLAGQALSFPCFWKAVGNVQLAFVTIVLAVHDKAGRFEFSRYFAEYREIPATLKSGSNAESASKQEQHGHVDKSESKIEYAAERPDGRATSQAHS
jgi:hypothetical protein